MKMTHHYLLGFLAAPLSLLLVFITGQFVMPDTPGRNSVLTIILGLGVAGLVVSILAMREFSTPKIFIWLFTIFSFAYLVSLSIFRFAHHIYSLDAYSLAIYAFIAYLISCVLVTATGLIAVVVTPRQRQADRGQAG